MATVRTCLVLLVLALHGCATNRKADRGYSQPTTSSEDQDFFIGSFLSGDRN